MPTWNYLAIGLSKTGTRVSPEIDLSPVKLASSSVISWEQTTPTGTSASVETNLALDGVTYAGWQPAVNGGAIAGIVVGTDLSVAKLQIRQTLSFADVISTPSMSPVQLVFKTALQVEEIWESPVWEIPDKIPTTHVITWNDNVPAGTNVVVEVRASDDKNYLGEWVAATKGQPLPVVGMYVQARARLQPDATRLVSPTFTDVTMNVNDCGFRGVWESPTIDCSQAKDKASGKAITQFVSGGGTLITQSRSSADGNTWTVWSDALPDGTLTHVANNKVQIRHLFTGVSLQVNETTVSFDGSPTAAQLATGFIPGAEYDFTTLKDIFIIVNGKDAPRKYDGATVSLLGGTPPIMSQIVTHHNRVWGVEVENPSRVRYSAILNPESWDVLNFIDFNPEDGTKITALYRYGQYLVVSKNKSMAVLTGDQTTNYSVVWLEGDAGAQGFRGMTSADKYLAFVAQDGIRFSDLTTSVLATERLIPDWEQINAKRLNQAAMIYWKHLLLVALPSKTSLYNDTVWVYDFLRNAWTIRPDWKISAFIPFNQYGEDILLGCDSTTGQVYQLLDGNHDIDNQLITYTWQSKDFTFGYPERYKLFKSVFLDIEGIAEETALNMTFIVDGEEKGVYTTTIPAGDGQKHTRWVLPPLYNAVLGSRLALRLEGAVGIQGISMEFIVRGIDIKGIGV